MKTDVRVQPIEAQSQRKTSKDISIASRIMLIFVVLTLLASFFVVIGAGERGVLMRFGKVENKVLEEGIHFIVPIINTVEKISARIQKYDIYAEVSSKDLQEFLSDVSLNWHIVPERANIIYQRIGNLEQVTERIIEPAVEEVLKGVLSKYTVQEIITKREEILKPEISDWLTNRLINYDIYVDDISLTNFYFSQNFREAVEAKQIAEQEAKRAGFLAQKAAQEAQAKINLAQGEAEAQRLLGKTLTPQLLQKQAIEKWNGNVPLVIGDKEVKLLNLDKLIAK